MNVYCYESKVVCSNCGFKGKVRITKEITISFHHCPKCNCETLKRFQTKQIKEAEKK